MSIANGPTGLARLVSLDHGTYLEFRSNPSSQHPSLAIGIDADGQPVVTVGEARAPLGPIVAAMATASR